MSNSDGLITCTDKDCSYCTKHLIDGKWENGGYWTDGYGPNRRRVRHDVQLISTRFGGTMEDKVDNDIINKPEHYTLPRAASDCFSVMQQIGLLDEHCIAVVFQYIWRCKLKGQKLQDLKKARWFLDKAIEHEESTKGH